MTRSVSAIVPAQNRAATAPRAIESIFGQTASPVEVIVVDDGSTDGTAEAVARFGDRVRYVYQENAGAAAARNRGVELASGEWVAFLDSDDYWAPDHLERIAAAIQGTGGRADLYFDDVQRTADEGGERLWALCGFGVEGPYRLVEDASAWALAPRQPMMLQASVFRRSAYGVLGGLWEALQSREDTHLFFKFCLGRPACAVAGLGTVMTSDDQSGERLTEAHGAGRRSYWEATVALYEDLLGGPYPLPTAARPELARRLAGAHLRLARFDWSGGHRAAALRRVARALARDPGRVREALGRRLGSGRRTPPDAGPPGTGSGAAGGRP